MRTNLCIFGGRYDRQRTLAIRIAAITLAGDSLITIARFAHLTRWRSKGDAKFSAFSAFSCPHFPRFPRFCSAESPQTLVFLGWEGLFRVFRIFPVSVIGFELLISKLRPTGFSMTGLRWPGWLEPSETMGDKFWTSLGFRAFLSAVSRRTRNNRLDKIGSGQMGSYANGVRRI